MEALCDPRHGASTLHAPVCLQGLQVHHRPFWQESVRLGLHHVSDGWRIHGAACPFDVSLGKAACSMMLCRPFGVVSATVCSRACKHS